MKSINCRKCIHYYITWDKSRPYGCRYFGFKSSYMPSLSVFKSSGEPCKAFRPKDSKDSDDDNNNPRKPKYPKYI